MKESITIVLILFSVCIYSQNSPTEQAQPIVEEGKLLYKSEMASWYGTDLFLKEYKEKENIGGYFSYTEQNVSKCIFFSNVNSPKVLGTISFDSTFSTRTAEVDIIEREFSMNENDLYQIRKNALAEIKTDTLFRTYQNTNLNLIPLIAESEKKVYVLTGPQQNGVVIFGNDYLLTFSNENKIIEKKQLHKNIIPIYYGEEEVDGKQIHGTMHSHLPATGEFITATDICTLMLYEKFAKWKTHNVVSEKYLNVWNCETDELTVITMDAIKEIDKNPEKQKEKNKKSE